MRTFLTLTVLLAGCTGDLVEIAPKTSTSGADMAMASGNAGGGGTAAGGDMAGGGSGGAVKFVSIQADLDAKICSSSACHGSTTAASNGGFQLITMATAAADLMANYAAVQNEINLTTPAMSLLLTNPAGLATPPHTGGTLFSGGTSDPTYQKWLAWITAGAPQ